MMNKRIALFLALALLLGFSAGYSERAGAYAAGQLPAGEDYALYGGMWYVYEAEMYGITMSAADLGLSAGDGFLLLNADGSAVMYGAAGTLDRSGTLMESMSLIWRVTADGAIAYPAEEWWEAYFETAFQDLPQELDEETIGKMKAQLKAMLVFSLQAGGGELTLGISFAGIGAGFPEWRIRFRHQPPEEAQPLPAMRSAADAGEFYGTWLWETLVLNEKQRVPIRSLTAALAGEQESVRSGSITIDESGIYGAALNGWHADWQFSDGQLIGKLRARPFSNQVIGVTISGFLGLDRIDPGNACDIDLTLCLCEDGSARLRYESAKLDSTMDIYFVKEPAGEKTFAEDDIVAGIESGAGKVYRSVGRFPGTDRYALSTKDPSDDGPVSMWEYAGAEGDPIYMMDVMGVAFPADFMVERAKSIYTDRNEAGERVVNGTTLSGITRSGLDWHAFCTGIKEETEGSQPQAAAVYKRQLIMYVATGEDVSVLVMVFARADAIEGVPDEDALVQRAAEFADLILPPDER